MHRKTREKDLTCSFCGKSQKDVRKLIAGPSVYICDECVELCNDIITEEYEREDYYATRALVPGSRTGPPASPARCAATPRRATIRTCGTPFARRGATSGACLPTTTAAGPRCAGTGAG